MTEHPAQPSADGAHRGGRHRSRYGKSRMLTILTLLIAVVVGAVAVTWVVRPQATEGNASGGQPSVSAVAQGAAADSSRAAGETSSPSTVEPGPFEQGNESGSAADSASAGSSAAQTPANQANAGSCPLPGGSLTVAASPDIADVVGQLAASAGSTAIADGCTVTVTAVDPAALIATGSSGADVWIPDSSMWVERAAAAGLTSSGSSPSVATSPVVLALPAGAAAQLSGTAGAPDMHSILATRQTAAPVRVGLPDPEQSAPAVGALLAAQAAVSGTTDARAALTWAFRSSPAGLPTHSDDLLDRLAADPNTAVPVPERAVVKHNSTRSSPPVMAIYPTAGAAALDYPAVTLSTDPQTVTVARSFVDLLSKAQGRAALEDAGFRAPDGTAGPRLTSIAGVRPDVVVAVPLPGLQQVDQAIHSVQVTNEPSRMLAVMDISGSMQSQVPGADGASRMDLAKEAATLGLGLYSADSEIGLWVFSRTLTPDSDHRELIPISTLGPDGQGGSGAQRLAQAIAGIEAIPDGGTGLYDTVLDAVRTVRATFDPTRVNAVLILSDGMNDDENSISLDALLATLTREQYTNQPVPVISIAFGPDSDVDALSRISKATGGAAYVSLDPRQIGEIFLDAVGQRLCRPSC